LFNAQIPLPENLPSFQTKEKLSGHGPALQLIDASLALVDADSLASSASPN
jgi:hypothetical protein